MVRKPLVLGKLKLSTYEFSLTSTKLSGTGFTWRSFVEGGKKRRVSPIHEVKAESTPIQSQNCVETQTEWSWIETMKIIQQQQVAGKLYG